MRESEKEAGEERYGARNEVEELMVGIWREVLGLDQVGIHDNFFELGGHSLLATRVISRVRKCFQLEIPLSGVFDFPTVAQLAARIKKEMFEAQGDLLPPIKPVPRGQGVPISFAQQRLWFLDQMHPGNAAYNTSFAVRLRGQLNFSALERSLGKIIERHETLRTTFAVVDGRPVQVVSHNMTFKLPLVDLLLMPEVDRSGETLRVAREEARRPFDLTNGPLIRAYLLGVAEDEHVLLLTIHHIICDGWSVGVLVEEFTTLYRSEVEGWKAALPQLEIHYADYAVWQRECLQDGTLEKTLAYWRRRLSGAPPPLRLPTGKRPPIQTFNGAREPISFPLPLTKALKEMSQTEGVTLFMTLLAAFNVLLYRYTGQTDILIGTPIAGRTKVEIERLIGFFTNMLVIRTDLSGDPTFRELLRKVRSVSLDAYANQALPFERLVEELQLRRDLSRNPLFQMVFSLQNTPGEMLVLPDLELSSLEIESRSALFDLMLELRESDRGINGSVEYNTDLFTSSIIKQIIDNFIALLNGVTTHPDRRIIDIPLTTSASAAERVYLRERRRGDAAEQFNFN